MIRSHSRQPHKDRLPVRIRPEGPSLADVERAEKLREVFEALSEVNKKAPVIVEGKRDAEALRRLGLEGEIIVINQGRSLYDFSEDLLDTYDQVVLLLDWDARGEELSRKLNRNLGGLWEEYSGFREILKILCQKDVKDIEGIPSLLRNLGGDEGSR